METVTIDKNELKPIVKELIIELLTQNQDILEEIIEDIVLSKEMDTKKK